MIIIKYFKLSRPINILISGTAMVIAASIVDNARSIDIMSITSLVVMFYTAAANILNDILDYRIDIINRPNRPIPSGQVKLLPAFILSFLTFLIGALLCLQLNSNAQLIGIIIAIPVMVSYNTYLKGKYLFGNIAVAFTIGLSFLFSGAAHDQLQKMYVPAFLAFGLTLIREIVKDIADIKGDSSVGLKTYPIYAGKKNASKLVIGLIVILGLGALDPYFRGIYGFSYLFILIIGVHIPLLAVVVLLIKNTDNEAVNLSSKILKLSTFMGLIAIYFGQQ